LNSPEQSFSQLRIWLFVAGPDPEPTCVNSQIRTLSKSFHGLQQDWLYFNIFQKESSIFLTFSTSKQISNTIITSTFADPSGFALFTLHSVRSLFVCCVGTTGYL